LGICTNSTQFNHPQSLTTPSAVGSKMLRTGLLARLLTTTARSSLAARTPPIIPRKFATHVTFRSLIHARPHALFARSLCTSAEKKDGEKKDGGKHNEEKSEAKQNANEQEGAEGEKGEKGEEGGKKRRVEIPSPPKTNRNFPLTILLLIGGGSLIYLYNRFELQLHEPISEWLNSIFAKYTDYNPPAPFLPPPLPANSGYNLPKYLLVIDTNELVVSEWDENRGMYRRKKRPYFDQFLLSSMPNYEILLWNSAEPQAIGIETVFKLDPRQMHSWRLFNEHVTTRNGENIKDIRYEHLRRDLDKVVVISSDLNEYKYHQENVIKIKKWDGANADTTLRDITIALDYIAKQGGDVRKVIESLQKDGSVEDRCRGIRERQTKKRSDPSAAPARGGLMGLLGK